MPVSVKPQCTLTIFILLISQIQNDTLLFYVSTLAFKKWLFQGNALAQKNVTGVLGTPANENKIILRG